MNTVETCDCRFFDNWFCFWLSTGAWRILFPFFLVTCLGTRLGWNTQVWHTHTHTHLYCSSRYVCSIFAHGKTKVCARANAVPEPHLLSALHLLWLCGWKSCGVLPTCAQTCASAIPWPGLWHLFAAVFVRQRVPANTHTCFVRRHVSMHAKRTRARTHILNVLRNFPTVLATPWRLECIVRVHDHRRMRSDKDLSVCV